MKTHIWNCTEAFPDKVNFVDTNNVILGYDLHQSCCEDALWKISSDKEGQNLVLSGNNESFFEHSFDGYNFDTDFFEEERKDDSYSEENIVIFRLYKWNWARKKEGGEDKDYLYLRLENHHNGYYSHGFIFRGAKTIVGSI